jgi:hypothetical protein
MPRSKRQIGTLVSDIKELLRGIREGKDIKVDTKDLAVLGASIALKIEKSLKARKSKRPEKTLFMSEIGTACHRKLWYSVNEATHGPFDKESLDYATTIKFMYGDILEELVLFLVEQAGHTVEDKQKLVEIKLPKGWVLRGKIDAKIDGAVVDVKSASSYSFEKFKKGLEKADDPFGYLKQLESYNYGLNSLDSDDTGFLAINKETGALVFDKHKVNPVPKVMLESAELIDKLEANKPPDRHYPAKATTGGNEKLGTECSYCPFKFECWKDANSGKGPRIFLYANKPEFLVKVNSVPRVMEIDRNGKK